MVRKKLLCSYVFFAHLLSMSETWLRCIGATDVNARLSYEWSAGKILLRWCVSQPHSWKQRFWMFLFPPLFLWERITCIKNMTVARCRAYWQLIALFFSFCADWAVFATYYASSWGFVHADIAADAALTWRAVSANCAGFSALVTAKDATAPVAVWTIRVVTAFTFTVAVLNIAT